MDSFIVWQQGVRQGLPPGLQVEALEHKALIYGIMFRDSKTAIDVLKQAETALEAYDAKNKPELQTRIYESFAKATTSGVTSIPR